ncbi:MAG: amidohydrolase [Chloroflexi bacterium]|nr:amidohydrolase [Chloroflexota bacterium]
MIVDIHIHSGLIPDQTPEDWARELYTPFKRPFDMDSKRPERIIADLDAAGVDIGLIQASDLRRTNSNEKRPGPYATNDYVAEVVAQYPDRLVGECGLDPIRDPWWAVKELDRCVKELGFKALKLLPTYGYYSPDDERIYPLYEKAIELDIPVHIHMGWTPTIHAPMKYQLPYLLDDVGIRYPELKVIVAHLGYPWVDECICLIWKHQNFSCDIAYWGGFPDDFILQTLLKCGATIGYERILYGSENNFIAMGTHKLRGLNKYAREHNLPEIPHEAMNLILGGNAQRILKIG